jgi:putative acetyltransferase
MTRNLTLVAVEDGEIRGFTELKEDGASVLMMFVHKDHQRQGIGSTLLDALEREAKGKGMTELRTEASITAVPFFKAHGFEIANEQNLHLKGEPFRNYAMRKRLG